jgi:hypothetical protein
VRSIYHAVQSYKLQPFERHSCGAREVRVSLSIPVYALRVTSTQKSYKPEYVYFVRRTKDKCDELKIKDKLHILRSLRRKGVNIKLYEQDKSVLS